MTLKIPCIDKSVSDFIHKVDFNFRCLCGVERAFFIDLLVHPNGYCKCECGISTHWNTENGRVRFSYSGNLMSIKKGVSINDKQFVKSGKIAQFGVFP